ncbi:unnamed protein product [Trichobilharzia regenti]|nr:unnamed protein product [Trichobilharzia regenti]
MIKGIVEPDLGDMDLKQFQFSFDNEPFSPLSNSLYKYHSVAVKSRTPMYSEVYSPMICINSSTTPRRCEFRF